MSKLCVECGAKCCRYFCFEIDEPEDVDEFEDVRWYLCHKGVSVHIDEDDKWFIAIMNPCRFLGGDMRCGIYPERPLICRKYDTDNCDQTAGDYGYKAEFKKPEDLEAYAREKLGNKEFDKARKKARNKLEKKAKKSKKKRTKK